MYFLLLLLIQPFAPRIWLFCEAVIILVNMRRSFSVMVMGGRALGSALVGVLAAAASGTLFGYHILHNALARTLNYTDNQGFFIFVLLFLFFESQFMY